MLIEKTINKLVKKRAKLVPCTEEEVEKLENHYKIRFPIAFKEYLLSMGHYAGELYEGSNCGYDNLFLQKEWQIIENDIAKNHEFKRTFNWQDENIFIFLDHGGYIVYFFKLDEGDDPPVYRYEEGLDDVKHTYSSFSLFLEEQFEIYYKER
jgi:SMI1 / KNR4 family (SUKH-1)